MSAGRIHPRAHKHSNASVQFLSLMIRGTKNLYQFTTVQGACKYMALWLNSRPLSEMLAVF